MTNVIKVVFQLLDRIFVAFAIGIIHLGPAGDPRLDEVPEVIKRNFFLVALGTLCPLRAWPNQAHVAPEHIPKLRQLVEPEFSQPAAQLRYSRVSLARVN